MEESARVRRKSLANPDQERRFRHGEGSFVDLGSLAVGRGILRPGWRWSADVQPNVGTPSCRIHHLHVLLSGRFAIEMDNGDLHEFDPMDVMDIPPGHDAWVIGDDVVEILDISGNVAEFGLPAVRSRSVGTMLMTDIVGSTERAVRMGDSEWKQLLGEHDRVVRSQLERFGGRVVKTTGDGFLAIFNSAGAALLAALAIRDATASLGIPIRAGVHTGEVEAVGDDIHGVAVHTAARVMSAAADGQVLTTAVTRALAEDAASQFRDIGEHALKGLRDPLRLFAVER